MIKWCHQIGCFPHILWGFLVVKYHHAHSRGLRDGAHSAGRCWQYVIKVFCLNHFRVGTAELAQFGSHWGSCLRILRQWIRGWFGWPRSKSKDVYAVWRRRPVNGILTALQLRLKVEICSFFNDPWSKYLKCFRRKPWPFTRTWSYVSRASMLLTLHRIGCRLNNTLGLTCFC